MGQKVHAVSFRLGYIKTWSSRWYANKKDFSKYLHDKNLQVNIRHNRGRDILAACGQLATRKSA